MYNKEIILDVASVPCIEKKKKKKKKKSITKKSFTFYILVYLELSQIGSVDNVFRVNSNM